MATIISGRLNWLPAWWSSSINVQPRLNSATQLAMVANNGALFP